jgi:hypothetical protein
MIARDHEHMRKLLYEKIDTIQGCQNGSMIELGCAFKKIFHCNISFLKLNLSLFSNKQMHKSIFYSRKLDVYF